MPYRLLKRKKHVYDSLLKDIRSQIQKKVLKKGDCILPENTLASKYNLSRVSVRAALRELVMQGLLCRQHGKGTFVAGSAAVSAGNSNALFVSCPPHESRCLDLINACARHCRIPIRLNDDSRRSDVSFDSFGQVFYKMANLLPLDQYIVRADSSRFFKVMWDKFRVDGRQYGIPCRGSTLMLYYNKDLFDRAGREYPDHTWNWETLAEAAQAMSRPEKGIYGYGNSHSGLRGTIPFVWQNNGSFFENNRASFCTPAVLEAIAFNRRLARLSPPADKCLDLFLSGRVAVCAGVAKLNQVLLRRPRQFKWGIAPLARGKTKATILIMSGYFIFRECQNPLRAWRLIADLISAKSFKKMLDPDDGCVADKNVQPREGIAALFMEEFPHARSLYEEFLAIPRPAAELAVRGLNKIMLEEAAYPEEPLLRLEQAVNLALERRELAEIMEH